MGLACTERVGVSCAGVELVWQGETLPNNSLVDTANITESTPLTCSTRLTPCCSEGEGTWRLPNGTELTEDANNTAYVTRGNQSITLNWANGIVASPGIYSCSLPNMDNVTETVYVGLYPTTAHSDNGEPASWTQVTKSNTIH